MASIPPQIRDKEPSLKYQFHYQLRGESSAISVGDRSAAVSALPPYQGWEDFRPRIDAFLTVLRASDLVRCLERFSLKFTNVIDVPAETQLALLNLEVRFGGVTPADRGFRLRTELNDPDLVRIVEIVPHSTATLPSGEPRRGLLLSVDCIRQTRSGSIDELTPGALEQIHHDLKQIFFGLITPATLSALEPVE